MTDEASRIENIEDLLIILGRTSFSGEEKKHAEYLCNLIDEWPLFTDLAIKNGIAALIWQNILDLNLSQYISDTECQILEGVRLKTIARVTFITGSVSEIVSRLEANGIKTILLKGQALERSVYGSRGLRQMSDIDLLVSRKDALKARDILINELGFISQPIKSSLYRYLLLDTGNHLPGLYRGGVSVDLHFRLFGQQEDILSEQALDSACFIKTAEREFNILPPDIAFLSMIFHLGKHESKGEFQLRLYNDLYLLLKNNRQSILDDRLLRNAKSAGVSSETIRVLCLMKYIFKVDIPEEFISGRDLNIDIDTFYKNLANPWKKVPGFPKEQYLNGLRSMPGTFKKLIYIAGDIFTSVSFMKKRYRCQTAIGCIPFYFHRLGKLFWLSAHILKNLTGSKRRLSSKI